MLEFSVQVLEHVLVTFSCVHDFLKQTQEPQVSKPYSERTCFPPKLHIKPKVIKKKKKIDKVIKT